MAKLTINGNTLEVEDGLTLLQACEQAGVEIPRFCYHDRLKIAGNCRMCLVQVEKSPKPVASCAMPVANGMVVHTNTPYVQKAREGVMEFLLINHPLDCPICDQGGECDLQDQAFKYGKGKNRYEENKRAVVDKNLGPLITTHMTRCIHCTRCVRFMTDIAGVEELGAVNRGEHMEITSYLEKALTSELSGNVIDLCPVGALNSKPYAYKARKWELKNTESVDVFDAMGCNIRIDSRGMEVMRILPKINEDINEEWISDKSRFSYDGLKMQRLDRCYIKKNGKHIEASWQEALDLIALKGKKLKGNQLGAIAGYFTDCETMFAMKSLLNKLDSSNHDFNQHGYYYDVSSRGNYLFNSSFAGVETADLILLIGTNVRLVAPALNARISKLVRFKGLKVARIGNADNQTYPIEELGDDASIIDSIISGKHKFSSKLKEAKNPIVIIGDGVYSREDAKNFQSRVLALCEKYGIIGEGRRNFNVLHNHASTLGALEIGFHPKENSLSANEMIKKATNGEMKLLFLLGADEVELTQSEECLVVYIGHHGDKMASKADVILPSAAYTEKNALFVNMEGRAQSTRLAVSPPNKAKEDWRIICKIANEMGVNLKFNSQFEIRELLKEQSPVFTKIDNLVPGDIIISKEKGKLSEEKVISPTNSFYQTDSITRASVTMAKCIKEIVNKELTA